MSEGLWVVVGAAIGTIGSIGTTWLAAQLQRQSPFPKYDKAVTDLLTAMLNGEPKWRKLGTLSRVTGLSDQDVKDYLIEMGGRGSEKDGELWGLISRNPLSEIKPD